LNGYLIIRHEDLPVKLFDQSYNDPDSALEYIREVCKKEKYLPDNIPIRFDRFARVNKIDEMRSKYLNKLSTFVGVVRSITKVQPVIDTLVYECSYCGNTVKIKQDGISVIYPDQGCICQKGKWKPNYDKSTIRDCQIVIVQDRPEGLRGGQVPAEIECRLFDDLCGRINAGDNAVVTGIMRTISTKRDSIFMKNIYEVNNIERIQRDFDEIELSDADISKIQEMSKSPDLYNTLVKSIAPSIYGLHVIKEAILLQLFGGVSKKGKDGTTSRGDIHILIIGDPGVAKSKILESVYYLCPRGIKVSGGGSTKAGLTATAVKDQTGAWTLEAGAVVLSDKGELIVDEIDKMNADDRASLHEAMEQQVVSIAKAGINTTLMARCCILAAANPKSGRFDINSFNVAEQIDLPPTLLSRFDLIFVLEDVPNETEDESIASFILDNRDEPSTPPYDTETVRKYISYARSHINPKMTAAAKNIIKKYYVNIRSLSKGGQKPVPITARHIDAAVRLSQASARAHLREYVMEEDAQRAVDIIDKCLKYIAYDPGTGNMDIDRVIGKLSAEKRDGITTLKAIIRETCKEGKRCEIKHVVACMEANGYTEDKP